MAARTEAASGAAPSAAAAAATPQTASASAPTSAATPAAGRGGVKRSGVFHSSHDTLEVTPLGSGQEVGRSCHLLRFKGKSILLDCGIHPAYTGINALPYFDELGASISDVDLLLISHFHLDHAAALPYFLTQTAFKGRVFMTHPTKSIYKLILQDYVKVSNLSIEDTLYTEKDLLNSLERIETVNYHEVVNHRGIRFWAYNAGHVLGAAMFMIEIAGVRILYTGDYSRKEDRHLMGAETPEIRPDVLIIESTFGVQTLQPIEERERRFTELVREIVQGRRGRCLLPVFALGMAQELLLILEEYWKRQPSLHTVPVYYASALAKKCMTVYQTYINMMNRRIQQQSQFSNPFLFKHIVNMKGIEQYDDSIGPMVIMCSPGMLQNGLSRELLELWCADRRNGVVLTGYSVEGTLAKHIMTEPPFIQSMTGEKLPFHISVNYVSFSAHADYSETSEFIELLKPPHVILVHGEATEGVGRLKEALQRKYNDGSMTIAGPKNCQTVELTFQASKHAKAVGEIARHGVSDGATMSGVLVKKDFSYHLMSSDDLPAFTPFAASLVKQSLKVPCVLPFSAVSEFIGEIYEVHFERPGAKAALTAEQKGDVGTEGDAMKVEKATTSNDVPTLYVGSDGAVELRRSGDDEMTILWDSNPVNDMVADSVIATIINAALNPAAAKRVGVAPCRHRKTIADDADWEEMTMDEPHSADHTHTHSHAHTHTHDDVNGDSRATSKAMESEGGSATTSDGVPSVVLGLPVRTAPLSRARVVPSLLWFLSQQYGDVRRDAASGDYVVRVDAYDARIDPHTLAVTCTNPTLRARIRRTLLRAHAALNPITNEHLHPEAFAVVEKGQEDDTT